MPEYDDDPDDPGLRRVCVHAGTVDVDLALPAAVPVAALIASIAEILGEHLNTDSSGDLVPTHLQLSRLGAPAMGASTTLAQNHIHDGVILVLSRSPTEPPAPCFDDAAEAVAATLDAAAQPWTRRAARLTAAVAASWLTGISGLVLIRSALTTNTGVTAGFAVFASCVALLSAVVAHRGYRDPIAGLTLGLIATGLSAVGGFLTVPGVLGAPNLLLSAMAAVATSALAMRLTGCGTGTFTAVSGFGLVIAVSALAAMTTGAPQQAIGSLSAMVSLGLLQASPRVSIALAGLSPRLPSVPGIDAGETPPTADRLAARAIRADGWSTSLLAAFSSSAAIGAICTAIAMPSGMPGLGGIALAAGTGTVLLLRARSQTDPTKTLILLASGIATISATFIVTAAGFPQLGPWIAAATTALATGALCLVVVTPIMSFSPVVRRSVELLEYLALAATVPLTCWICGLYPAIYQATGNLNLLTT